MPQSCKVLFSSSSPTAGRVTHNIQPLVHCHSHLRPQGLGQNKHVSRHGIIWPEKKNKGMGQISQGGKFIISLIGERKVW